MNIFELDKTYVAATYGRFPVDLVSGKGALIWDNNGKEYIDLGSGIAVTSFGIADEQWQEAVTRQLGKLQHTSNLYYTEPCAQLAEMLCQRTGMKKVFFSNSGAEANECSIKAARLWASKNKGSEYYTIITLKNSFHGRTITTLAATGQDAFHQDFLPLTPGFAYVHPGDLEGLEQLLKENKCAGILFEPVQGEGGVLPLSPEFVKGMAALAEKYNVLLMVDEVQTGNGRTGKLYGYMHYGIQPDIVSTAKGLAGGLPLGATMFSQRADVLGPGMHGSTFGGNPVCCAGAISILSRIDETLLSQVQEKSAYVFDTLQGAPGVRSVSGMGLMIGIETEKDASQVIADCMEQGVLVLKAKNKVRLLPSLNIPMEQLKKAVEILKGACAQ
jgi:acetylornithine/N-succinyldiaminopimelate aminotransferase